MNRRLRILWLGLRGQLEFQRGCRSLDLEQAKSTFDELATLDDDSFLAHIHLGRIAEIRQQTSLALVHFGLAFQIDAERFYRAPIGAALKRRIATREGLIRAGFQGPRSAESLKSASPELEAFRPGTDAAADLGDFSSAEEQARFARREPISRDEIAATDLDALLRRLLS